MAEQATLERNSEFLTTADVARACGVSRTAVWLWIRLGALRAQMIGPVYVVTQQDFERFRAKRGRAARARKA